MRLFSFPQNTYLNISKIFVTIILTLNALWRTGFTRIEHVWPQVVFYVKQQLPEKTWGKILRFSYSDAIANEILIPDPIR